MVPRRLRACELILEQEGVYGHLETEDLQMDFLPLDADIISLESPHLLKSVFMVGLLLSCRGSNLCLEICCRMETTRACIQWLGLWSICRRFTE